MPNGRLTPSSGPLARTLNVRFEEDCPAIGSLSVSSQIGQNWTVIYFLDSGLSRQGATTTRYYLSVLSLNMRTDILRALRMNQPLMVRRLVWRNSIVLTARFGV
jgi:hypothetical protein